MSNEQHTDDKARNGPSEAPDVGFTVKDRRFWQLDEEELEQSESAAKAPAYVEQLEANLKRKEEQLREYIAAHKKEVVEELDKTKERLTRDAAQQLAQARGQLAAPMMEVLEAIERSVHAAEAGGDPAALLEGVKMVQLLMVQKLKQFGLERVETIGAVFDPAVHEAVAVAPVTDPQQDNVVLAEISAGFSLEGKIFRPAKVQVGKAG